MLKMAVAHAGGFLEASTISLLAVHTVYNTYTTYGPQRTWCLKITKQSG